MSADKLIVVSGDGHAEPPPEVWKDYADDKFREYLPGAVEDSERFVQLLSVFSDFKTHQPEMLEVIDTAGTWELGLSGGSGNVEVRLAEMDREGIAAEMIYWGNTNALHPGSPAFRTGMPQEFKAAGSRIYNRWLADVYGGHPDRLYLVGDAGAEVDIDAMVSEVGWIAERGFRGTYLPQFFARADVPPLYDEYFDPFWAKCVDEGLFVVCHAGYGTGENEFGKRIDVAMAAMAADGRDDLLDQLNNRTKDFFHRSYLPYQAMWQLMLGGVFDRFPGLRLILTEVRADWMPSMLTHLDSAFDRANGDVAAKRKPSDYWRSNCLQSVSFIHKCEVPLRHEIGLENICFGRDYPHPEGTWPNTREWLRDAFNGVPEDDLRAMLGENPIRMLGLDRAELQTIADRVGPSIDEFTGPGPELDERMIESWDNRSGYLKPAEFVDPDAIDAMLNIDPGLAAAAR